MLAACLVLAALLLVNGILAMSELAIMTSRASRLERDARRGSKGAASALALAREPTRFLSTVQVGITLIGIFSGAFGEKALAAPLREMLGRFESIKPFADEISLAIVVTLITYVSLVFGELVPKRIAMAYPESSAAIIAQLGARERTDTDLLGYTIEGSLDDPDFFARKAIGWALREYSKTDEAWVRRFVAGHALSPLSRREALKWLAGHGVTAAN